MPYDGEFVLEADFQGGGLTGNDVRNVWIREGPNLRSVGRLINKKRFVLWGKCKLRNTPPSWNLPPIQDYITNEERNALVYDWYDGDGRPLSKIKWNKYHPSTWTKNRQESSSASTQSNQEQGRCEAIKTEGPQNL